jgi:hypothetical protein
MGERIKSSRRWKVGLFLVLPGLALVLMFPTRPVMGLDSQGGTIAEGGGTTIIHGGTGAAGGFIPVLTTVGFHAEKTGGQVTGSFDCLALAPETTSGSKSGQFTVNAMYVAGQITGATVNRDTATLTGTADITGLGAGSNVSFTFVVRNGGPGATAVLTANGLTFNELLVEGSFRVRTED